MTTGDGSPNYQHLRFLRLEGLPVFESTFKCWLHLHLTELSNGEIETIDRLGLPVRIVLQEQPGKLKPGKGVLGAETSTGRPCSQPPGAGPDFVSPTEEGVLSLR